jgi:hypothetical protein
MFELSAIKKTALAVAASVVLISCAAAPTRTMAQAGSDIPILVMGEDSDPMSVKRTSDIFRRVILAVQEQMSRYDFYVVDEYIIATELGWQVRERRPITELMQVVQLTNQANDPRLQVRAMVTFKIRAAAMDVGFAKKAQVRIAGEIYDYEARRFIGAWEAPRMQFPAPAGCTGFCIQEVVGDKARDIAATVGDVLRKKLAYLTRGAGATASTGGSTGTATSFGTAPGLTTTYAVTFKNFTTREILEITEVMENEFPNYVTARAPSGDTTKMVYGYVSKAPANKMYKWMNILLMDMGLDPDSKVKVIMQGSAMEIDKLFGSSPVQTQGGSRFQ